MTLVINNLNAWYGAVQVLRGLHLELAAGEVLCLFGRNGAGKTTALKSIMGLIHRQGSIQLNGEELVSLQPHLVPRAGIGYVPQGRRLFAEMTVAENLELGLMTRSSDATVCERVLEIFTPLKPRLNQQSGTLSGGEQQMLAMARALCIEPSVILLDEPTEGLMPSMIAMIRQIILKLRQQGVAILLVEQRVNAVLPVANRVAFVENGQIKETTGVEQLATDDSLLNKYVGVSHV